MFRVLACNRSTGLRIRLLIARDREVLSRQSRPREHIASRRVQRRSTQAGIQYRPVFRLPSIRGWLLPRAPTPLEPITQDHLDDQAIRTRCQAEADSEVELPLGPEVEVDHGEELVLLIVRSVEVGHRA